MRNESLGNFDRLLSACCSGSTWRQIALLGLICVASKAAAQDGFLQGADRKTVRITRTDTPPIIDGRLDETVWSTAEPIDDLHQVNPVEYNQPTVATNIYLLYTSDALYVGARLLDAEAEDVSARVLRQGERFISDDFFGVILDPFNDRRNGYQFRVNANSVREEQLFQNTSQQNRNWEGIWRAAASRTDDGWIAEMEIPFKTLSFDPNGDTWGINFNRWVPRKNEWIGWVSRNRSMNPSIAGAITGLEGMEQGVGLDVVPSISVRGQRAYGPTSENSDTEPSLDVFYKLTPSLNASLTFNTDFSATEVDDRQVDLSRFNLFFPEKREFFLRDADIFEFGRLGSIGNFGAGPKFSQPSLENGRPFFSRTLGLGDDGLPVNLNYGGKISGRIGRWNIGTLAIQQDQIGDVEATDIFVGRVAANVLEQSTLGVIATSGDPRSNLDNELVGLDFRYLNTRLASGRVLQGDAWVQRSRTEGLDGDDGAYGARLQLPAATGFRGSIGVKEIEENFNPALGFVNRVGIRDNTLELGYTRRPQSAGLQEVFTGIDVQQIDLLSGGTQTEIVTFRPLEIETRTRDSFDLAYLSNKEFVDEAFEISEGIVITPGLYAFDNYGFDISTGQHRSLSGTFTFRTGEFYDGDILRMRGALTWAPIRNFRAAVTYDFNDIDLPAGDFIVRLVTLRTDIVFSSTLSWVNLFQYDNVTETVGLNSRLHWIPEAGREAFIVLNHSLQDADRNDSFHSTNADLTLKFTYTFRF